MQRSRFFGGCSCQTPTLGRRGFLGAATALAATAVSAPSMAQSKPRRIDTHHHVCPPTWVEALKKANMSAPPINNWTPEHTLADMDAAGTQTSMLSVTQPAVTFLPAAEAAALARSSNEYIKSLTEKYPGRFGMFAMVPMPYVDETLKEIAYAMDVLKADGIGFMTSFGNKWLGHPDFMPVMEELNRRKAVVYTHPLDAACCVNLASLPGVAIEYGTDTTRTIGNLVMSGVAEKVPDVKFIFSHAGGSITSFIERFTTQLPKYGPTWKDFTYDRVMAQIGRFYYDTAQTANPVTMGALRNMVAPTQIVFGSDYPYRTSADQYANLQKLFDAKTMEMIGGTNAQKILPHWA